MLGKRYLNRRGQALVEFILIWPILIFLLLFGIMAFFIISDYLTLQQMTREAARLGATDSQIAYLTSSVKETNNGAVKLENQKLVVNEIKKFGTLHIYDLELVSINIVNAGRDSADFPDYTNGTEVSYVHAVTRMKLKPSIPRLDKLTGVFAFMTEVRTTSGLDNSGFPPNRLSCTFDMRPQRPTGGGGW